VNRRTTAILLALAVVMTGVLIAGCGGLPGNAVAKVGEVLIPDAKYTSQVESFATQYGVSKDTDLESYQALAADVLQSMVTTELAVQKAASFGISVTDAEVQARIDSIVADSFGGDESALVTYIASQSMTMDDVKREIKNTLLTGAVWDKVTKDAAAPTDEAISAYYAENKASYLTEQTIEARHILIGVSDVTVRSAATTTTTVASTTETTASTETQESTTTTTLSELAWAKALATAAEVRAQLLAGGSWSRLAAAYSDDKDTNSKGGNLGTVLQGALVDTLGQEFDTEVFSLELNQVSEPIKTANGYELIQVTKITEPRQKTLEEAKADIAAVLLVDAQDAAWQKFIDQAKLEIKVVYRSDVRPAATTTTVLQTTTTIPTTATTILETTTTAKP
jgi:foldase protein PrsA